MKWTYLLLALQAIAYAGGRILQDESPDYSMLGTNDMSEIEYEMEFDVDEDCHYTLHVSIKHNPEFFVGTADGCKPGVDDPYDGRPVLEGRWRWAQFPLHIRESTGLNHVSVDYNPCGHPGPGFSEPHYDAHFYTVSPEYRAVQMICLMNYGNPTCAVDQDTAAGKGFFNVARSILSDELSNMPPNYSVLKDDAVIHMGLHALDISKMPNVTGTWEDPVLVICTHDSNIVAFEPMWPYSYVTGDQDRSFEDNLTYVEQSIDTLPYYYRVEYKADTKRTHVTVKGLSNVCSTEELERLKAEDEKESDDGDTSGSNKALLSALHLLLAGGLFLCF